MVAGAAMFAAASGMTSCTVAAGLTPAARQRPTDAIAAAMQPVCQTFIARSPWMASVQRLFAWSCGLWVTPLRKILRFKCGERGQAFSLTAGMCPIWATSYPSRETLVGSAMGHKRQTDRAR